MEQKTVKEVVTFEGVGIHEGKISEILFKPAPVNHGVFFTRTDLENKPSIKVAPENLMAQERSTGLADNGAKVRTVEHILAALAGLGLSNVDIEINSEEPPILDGSALPYAEELGKKIMEQNRIIKPLELKEPVWVEAEKSVLVALPSPVFKIFCYIDFPGTAIGQQIAAFQEGENDFLGEIAPARTFGFWHEIEELRKQGLALGGSLDNAVIVGEKVYSTPLRFAEEPARHKLLDLMGDLYLLGRPLKAFVIAIKTGHLLNAQLLKKIVEKVGSAN